jgi:hypothetical protein
MQRLLDDRDATIRDLRQRLDDSEAERRGVQAQLTALLAAPAKAAEPDHPRRPPGRRILAWLARQHGW